MMGLPGYPEEFLVLIIAGTAVGMDLVTYKIDNRFILISLASGMIMHARIRGPAGVLDSAGGVLAAFSVLILLFVFRVLGAGDIKLFCVLGTILGPAGILNCIAGSFLLGAVLSLILMIFRGIFAERFLYFAGYVKKTLREGKIRPYREPGMRRPEHFHFTVPVFLACVLGALYGFM